MNNHGNTAPTSATDHQGLEETPEYRQFLARKQSLLSDTGNPYFIAHDSPLTDKSYMDGRWVLNFGSYNYAGMSGRQEVSDAAIDAIRRYGTSASGSRLLAGEKSLDPGTGAHPSRLEACGGCAGAGGRTLHKRHLCGKLLP